MNSKEESIKNARVLFNPRQLVKCGQRFYRYSERISVNMISRKGLEREVTNHVGMPMTLITRHDVENNMQVFATERVAVLQATTDYERDQERATSNKAKKLAAKYAR